MRLLHILLYRRNIIFHPAKKPEPLLRIQQSVGCPGVSFPGLPGTPGVKQILPVQKVQIAAFGKGVLYNPAIRPAAEKKAQMAVPKESQGGPEQGKVLFRVQGIENIMGNGAGQCSMKKGKDVLHYHWFQPREELPGVRIQLLTGPSQRSSGMFIEVVQIETSDGGPVMVSRHRAYRQTGELPYALIGKRAVTDYIPQTEYSVPFSRRILQYCRKGRKIRVNIGDYKVSHAVYYYGSKE
jgi:hypothetical protein